MQASNSTMLCCHYLQYNKTRVWGTTAFFFLNNTSLVALVGRVGRVSPFPNSVRGTESCGRQTAFLCDIFLLYLFVISLYGFSDGYFGRKT